jgi:hypothetical protein
MVPEKSMVPEIKHGDISSMLIIIIKSNGRSAAIVYEY